MRAFETLTKRVFFVAGTALLTGVSIVGCDGTGVPVILPFGQVTAVQLFEQTNYTMALSVESAVLNPSAVARVNWVFGDGGGFVEGPNDRATMTHRYTSPGDYEVTAYVFGADGFVDKITSTISVDDNPGGEPPTGTPNPEDLPGLISAPFPANDATSVAVVLEMKWTSGILTDTFDIYFGENETEVSDAANSDAAFKVNQSASKFDPGELKPDTDYYWRVDGVSSLGVTKGDVLHFTTAKTPLKAKNPSPGVGSTTARVNGVLSWKAGERAASHDVYFGKDSDAVLNATKEDDTVFAGNQSAAQFDPEDDDADVLGELLADTEYFWRVDEVGPGGTAKGDVWSFRTATLPPKVTMPVPTDGATDVNVEQVMTWVSSPEIETFDVYLGTDAVDVLEAQTGSPQFQGNLSVTTFDPSSLLGSTVYFWRVDTNGRGGKAKGDVFSFTTIAPPGQVVGPFEPLDDAANVTINPELKWHVGANGPTTQFRVYLSDSNSAVVNGENAALRATQDMQFTSFKVVEASALQPDTLYYWRVDAIGPGGRTTGPVLSFTTGSEPTAVSGPSPANNAKGVALGVTFQWSAATGATEYDIYLGTTQSDVDNADTNDAEFRATLAGTSHSPGELQGNLQYFWRIDSRGPGGTTKGPIWKFTTAPAKATSPTPLDEADQVSRMTNLTWTLGAGATSHDVYLGTNEAAVQSATRMSAGIFRGNQTSTTYDPPTDLDGATIYYWRIDEVTVDGTTSGEVWQFETIAGQATDPVPANGAVGASLTPSLDWTPDASAVSHDVYFGTTKSGVESANTGSGEFQGNFALGNAPPFQPPNALDGLTFFFWRVDTVTANATIKGDVWQFRTGPGRATSPTPANFAMNVAIDSTLTWVAGNGAVTQDVYLGTIESDVMNSSISTLVGTTTRVTVNVNQISPGPLTANTTYFWRVDSVASNGTTRTTGTLWRFTTLNIPDQAGSPTPFNGATGIETNVTLNWGTAARATSYDVYFGTSAAAVENADMMSPEYQGNRTSTSYQPSSALANLTTFYWRIDAVNAAGVRKGVLWSFTTKP